MQYYYIIPIHQNNNTLTQQNRITPKPRFHRHFCPDFLPTSAKSRTFVSARPPIGKRLATRPQGESMRTGIASCAFVATKPSDGVS